MSAPVAEALSFFAGPRGLSIILIVLAFGSDGALRANAAAKSLKTGSQDRKTTPVMNVALALTLVAVAVAPSWLGFIPRGAQWTGVGAMVAGFSLRTWAMRVLGAFYTRTLLVQGGQGVVSAGPYRLVRHPGYLGSLLQLLGAGLGSGSVAALAVIAVAMVSAYAWRITSEERMLVANLGEAYREYAKRTWRLLPFVY